MNSEADNSLDPAVMAALYLEHADELRRFLTGVLRDQDLAVEVLQLAFLKAFEVGGRVQEESRKAWLFRVAFNEAMAIKRRKVVGDKIVRRLAHNSEKVDGSRPEKRLVQWETVQLVRGALDELPAEQRQVVHMRIYEEKTFAEIAAELGLPLGTVLSRMQLATKKLRGKFSDDAE